MLKRPYYQALCDIKKAAKTQKIHVWNCLDKNTALNPASMSVREECRPKTF